MKGWIVTDENGMQTFFDKKGDATAFMDKHSKMERVFICFLDR